MKHLLFKKQKRLSSFTRQWTYVSTLLLATLVLFIIYFPNISTWLSATLLISSLSATFFFIAQKHIQPYKQGQITRVKFTRNILLDLLGLLLTVGAASYLGGMAGMWTISYGLWAGIIAGMAVGFMSAWLMRKTWEKVIAAQ